MNKFSYRCFYSASLVLVKQGSVSYVKRYHSVTGLRPLVLFKKEKLILLLCTFISIIEA